jgi:DNA-binding LytR/AlgR family response regulator
MDMIKSNQLFQFELHDNTMIFEDISRIIYFFSIRHDIYFYTEQNTHRLSYRFMTMEELETKLFPWGYIRIHKTFLVNFRFIYQIQENSVILDEGSQRITLPISRRRISAVKKQYHQLLREGDAL